MGQEPGSRIRELWRPAGQYPAGYRTPVVVVTTRGRKSGKVRKFVVMRVEHNGEYALIASKGGAPMHPLWYHSVVANPSEVTLQDGPAPFDVEVREVSGAERATWWDRAVAAFHRTPSTRPRPSVRSRFSLPAVRIPEPSARRLPAEDPARSAQGARLDRCQASRWSAASAAAFRLPSRSCVRRCSRASHPWSVARAT